MNIWTKSNNLQIFGADWRYNKWLVAKFFEVSFHKILFCIVSIWLFIFEFLVEELLER